MTLDEKLKYVIKVLNEILQDSKTIGDLPDYSIEEEKNLSTYIGVFDSTTGKTLKIDIDTLLSFAANVAIAEHTHEIEDTENLPGALIPVYTDGNNGKWKVEREVENYNFAELVELDIISGFEDYATDKKIFIKGVVLDPTLEVPADLSDKNKFFTITKKIRL